MSNSDKVEIYKHHQFQGSKQELSEGLYDFDDFTFGHDQLSSLKVPAGMIAKLYVHAHYQGRSADFISNTSFVGAALNDHISSIKVQKFQGCKVARIVSVKCIKPSSGIGLLARAIFGSIGAAIGAVAGVATSTASGGVLVGVGGLAAVGGAGAGVKVIEGLDSVFSGEDDLYIKVNDRKIWPLDRYKEINSQETVSVAYAFPVKDKVRIDLIEWDRGGDDPLGYLEIPVNHQDGYFDYVVSNKDEGSIYEIKIEVVTSSF